MDCTTPLKKGVFILTSGSKAINYLSIAFSALELSDNLVHLGSDLFRHVVLGLGSRNLLDHRLDRSLLTLQGCITSQDLVEEELVALLGFLVTLEGQLGDVGGGVGRVLRLVEGDHADSDVAVLSDAELAIFLGLRVR